jgi:hypothetical protein
MVHWQPANGATGCANVVRVYDYVDSQVLMLARMYARRLKGYGAIGYRIGTMGANGPSP